MPLHKLAYKLFINLPSRLKVIEKIIMTLTDKRKLVKANAGALSLKVTDIQSMTEAQLDEKIALISTDGSGGTVSEDTVMTAVETNDVFVTEKGETVPVLKAVFDGTTTSAFRFKFADKFIISNDNDIRFLYAKGGLKEGDVVSFKPETIVYNGNMNAFTGTVNKSATPSLMKVVEFRNENRIVNDAQIAELTAQGINPQVARELVQAEIVKTIKIARPVFKLD
jgi:hypothetical protein